MTAGNTTIENQTQQSNETTQDVIDLANVNLTDFKSFLNSQNLTDLFGNGTEIDLSNIDFSTMNIDNITDLFDQFKNQSMEDLLDDFLGGNQSAIIEDLLNSTIADSLSDSTKELILEAENLITSFTKPKLNESMKEIQFYRQWQSERNEEARKVREELQIVEAVVVAYNPQALEI